MQINIIKLFKFLNKLIKRKVNFKSLNPKHQQKNRFKHYLKMSKYYNNKNV